MYNLQLPLFWMFLWLEFQVNKIVIPVSYKTFSGASGLQLLSIGWTYQADYSWLCHNNNKFYATSNMHIQILF